MTRRPATVHEVADTFTDYKTILGTLTALAGGKINVSVEQYFAAANEYPKHSLRVVYNPLTDSAEVSLVPTPIDAVLGVVYVEEEGVNDTGA